MNATTVILLLFASALLFGTVRAYERWLTDERAESTRLRIERDQAHRLLAQTRHPSRREEGERGLTSWQDVERERLDPRTARHLHLHVAGEDAS